MTPPFHPASHPQRQFWVLQQLNPKGTANNVPFVFRVSGDLDRAALERSLAEVLRRHDVFRTRLVSFEGNLVQRVEPFDGLDRVLEVRRLPSSSVDEDAWVREVESWVRQPFDLSRDSPIRFFLGELGDREHVFGVMWHHVVGDQQTEYLFAEELTALYSAFRQGLTSPLPPVEQQYADLVAWQSEWPHTEEYEKKLARWRRDLHELEPILDLHMSRAEGSPGFEGREIEFCFEASTRSDLLGFCREATLSPTVALLAGYFAVIWKYTGQRRLAIGVPFANRGRNRGLASMGCFVNTLPIYVDLSGDPSFEDIAKTVRKRILRANQGQDVPFDAIVESLGAPRSSDRNPLFQHCFTRQEAPMPLELDGLELLHQHVHNGGSKFDTTIYMWDDAEEQSIRGFFEFRSDLFSERFARRFLGHFEHILNQALREPRSPLSGLRLLTPPEVEQLARWNATSSEHDRTLTLHQLVERTADRHPDRVALVVGRERLTYRELDARADRVAQRLVEVGVRPGALVCVCLDRGIDLVPTLLGVLKAGGAYVPVDPAYPPARQSLIIEDSAATCIVTEAGRSERFSDQSMPVLAVEDLDLANPAGERLPRPGGGASPHDLAYVIYTSGSTGRPKGVAIEHHSPTSLIHWGSSVYSPDDLAGTLFATSICFDLSVFEIFMPLARGGTIIQAENALALPSLPASREVTLVNTVPSAIRELIRGGGIPSSVRVVNLAGEALRSEVVDSLYDLGTVERVYDLYGPSEDTTYSTCASRVPGGPETIGQPILNTRLYVMGPDRQPQPVGVTGEIHLAGEGLARGYLNRPELTDEVFFAAPAVGEERVYRTGDLAQRLPDGNILFLGRIGHQVKLRGFRIELGEIETALREAPGVTDAAVSVRADRPDDQRLVAYVVLEQTDPDAPESLRRHLAQRLPVYMIPQHFVSLERLPLTPNGKLDRRALPAPEEVSGEVPRHEAPPSTPTEHHLFELWKKVLGRSDFGVHQSFFDLGGHSLLAARMFGDIEAQLGEQMPLSVLFETPTIQGLASRIDAASPNARSPGRLAVRLTGSDGKGRPIFIVAGALGNVLNLYPLADLLPGETVYGLQARGLNGEPPFESFEEAARCYLEEVSRIQPHGPYLFGGFCAGGLAAVELARSMRARGEEVGPVILLDAHVPPEPKDAHSTLIDRVLIHWTGLRETGLSYLPAWLKRRFQRDITRSLEALHLRTVEASHVEERSRVIFAATGRALRAHRQRPYPGPALLVRPPLDRRFRLTRGRIANRHRELVREDNGWRPFIHQLRIRETSAPAGAHDGFILPPYVEEVASYVREEIERWEGSRSGPGEPPAAMSESRGALQLNLG